MSQQKNPRQELNEFYQRFKGTKPPDYQTQQAPCEGFPGNTFRFICNLTCPAVEANGEGFSEQVFQGEGKNKKDAMSNAAVEAIAFLKQQPLFDAAKPYDESLWWTISKICSHEGLRKDPEIEGYLLLAQQYGDGRLPLSTLTQSRILRGWFKEYCPEALNDHVAMMKVVKERLETEKPNIDTLVTSGIILFGEGLSIRRKQPYIPPGEVQRSVQNVVEDAQPTAVVLPADSRSISFIVFIPNHCVLCPRVPVREVAFAAEGFFLDRIAELLGCSGSEQAVLWGRVGHKAHYVAHPAELAEARRSAAAANAEPAGPVEAPGAGTQGTSTTTTTSGDNGTAADPPPLVPPQEPAVSHGGPLASTTTVFMDGPAAMDWAANNSNASEVRGPAAAPERAPSVASMEEDQHGGHALPVSQPSLYSVYPAEGGAAPLNLRASWLAGRPVRGDAVMSLTRMSPGTVGRFTVKWRSYTETDFWRTMDAGFPGQQYPKSLHAPVLARLPAEYRCASSWAGQQPRALLEAYCAQHSWKCVLRYEGTVADADDPESAVVTLEVTPMAGSEPLSVTAGPCLASEVAYQRAALALLHRLQAVDAAVLGGKVAPSAEEVDASLQSREQRTKLVAKLAAGVQVVQRGEFHSRHVEPGAIVKVCYRVYLPKEDLTADVCASALEEGEEEYLVERRDNFVFELGAGAVVPELEAAATCLMAGGSAQCRVSLALEGTDPLGRMPRVPCMLCVQLAHVGVPGREHGAPQERGPKVFDPSLGLQRYQFVANLASSLQATIMVDLGCGEGRLLEHMVRNAAFTPLRRLAGVEISPEAVVSASKRLAKTVERVPILRDVPPGAAGDEPPPAVPQPPAPAAAAGPSQESFASEMGENAGGLAPERSVSGSVDGGSVCGVPAAVAAAVSQAGSSGGGNGDVDSWRVHVDLLQGSIAGTALLGAGGWGQLAGCDLAACVEVIEHLDPELLALLGPSILGGLRPKVATVTTPNWEYNAVLRALENGAGWPGPPGRDGLPLRCADHRFEWTRAEFEEWANTQARAFGYSVRFEGIGRAIREEELVASASYTGSKEVGCATQAAIFTQLSAATPAATPAAAAAAGGAEGPEGPRASPLVPMFSKDIWAVMGDLQEGVSVMGEAPETLEEGEFAGEPQV